MKDEHELGFRVRHVLDEGTERISPKVADRLFAARQKALQGQRVSQGLLSLPGIGHMAADIFLPHMRTAVAVLGLIVGIGGVHYWNMVQEAADLEEVDSALLSDELPINAYLDSGFDAWLKTSDQQ